MGIAGNSGRILSVPGKGRLMALQAVLTPLPASSIVSTGGAASPLTAMLEDKAVWSATWVCIGTTYAIPNPGDLLPYTVGYQGLHVERLTGGGIVGRFNKQPHGGCRFVPVQCQTGTKTKCSFTSCGHSRDRGTLRVEDTIASHQYVGLRPERLPTFRVAEFGPLLMVHLGGEPADLPQPMVEHSALSGAPAAPEAWYEYSANWKTMGASLAAGERLWERDDCLATRIVLPNGETAECRWLFPNLLLLLSDSSACVIVLQPTALHQTLLRVTPFGAPAPWVDMIEQRRLAAAGAIVSSGDAAGEFMRRRASFYLGASEPARKEKYYDA
jgi:hypothetical protein